MSPGEVAEGFGWGPIVTLALSTAAALLGYGASSQRNKRTAADLAKLETEHDAAIAKAHAAGEQAGRDLAAYMMAAREKYVPKDDLKEVEGRLSEKIANINTDLARKVDEIKADLGRRNINHEINTAITKGMAQVLAEVKRASAQ